MRNGQIIVICIVAIFVGYLGFGIWQALAPGGMTQGNATLDEGAAAKSVGDLGVRTLARHWDKKDLDTLVIPGSTKSIWYAELNEKLADYHEGLGPATKVDGQVLSKKDTEAGTMYDYRVSALFEHGAADLRLVIGRGTNGSWRIYGIQVSQNVADPKGDDATPVKI